MADEESKPLRKIGGFELIIKIGQGGMGTVFKARQVSLDRIVAVKILPPSIAKDEKFIDRFQKEARATAKLNHPNIVQGIDVAQDKDTGLWFFAMEYVDGPSLKTVLNEKKTIPEAQVLEIARQMGRALECAHTAGFVHRDVKPDNILLTSHGDAKLADLGLAKQASDESVNLAQEGQAIGTPYYMAPEQARGAINEIDIRTDIYALGCTLYHLVTGQPPFTGPKGSAILVKHLTEKAPLANQVAPNVSEACARLIERMMQKEKDKRIQTPKDVVAQVEKVIKQNSVAKQVKVAKAVKTTETAQHLPVSTRLSMPRPQRSQVSSGLSALVFVAILGVGVLWLYKQGKATPVSEVAVARPSEQKKAQPSARPNPSPVNSKPVPPPVPKEREAPPPVPKVVEPPVAAVPKANEAAEAKKTDTPPATPAPKTDPAVAVPANGAAQPKKDDPPAAAQKAEPAAAPARPAGPDPMIQIAHAKFLGEVIQRCSKDRKDLAKVVSEMREQSEKPEYAKAKSLVADELKDLERALQFEEKALDVLGAAKGDLELPEDMQKLARGAKTGKIIRSDRGRGLFVSVGGVEVPVAASKLPPHKFVDAAGEKKDGFAAASYCLVRGAADEARTLIAALPDADRAKMERKLEILKVGAAEGAAQDAYKEILLALRAKQWQQVREKITAFETAHGQTGVGMQKLPTLAACKEFAEQSLTPPVVKLFHAKSGKMVADGFIQLSYDFTTPEQLLDFACDHGALTLENGYMKVPAGGGEFAQARFIAPLAEIRAMEVTGKVLKPIDEGAPRFGVYIYPPGVTTGNTVPKCICRIMDSKPHLECWEPPYTAGTMNATGPKELNWAKDTVFLVEATGASCKWSVNGIEVGVVKPPPAAVGGRVAFVSVAGEHVWKDFKLVFKPDAAWVKQQTEGTKAAPAE